MSWSPWASRKRPRALVDVLAAQQDSVAFQAFCLHPRLAVERRRQVVDVHEAVVAFHDFANASIGAGVHRAVDPVVGKRAVRCNQTAIQFAGRLLSDDVVSSRSQHMSLCSNQLWQFSHLHHLRRIETLGRSRSTFSLRLSQSTTHCKQRCKHRK